MEEITTQLFINFFAAAMVGAIIGLEREKSKQKTQDGLDATSVGIRTDILISLFGAISIVLGQKIHYSIFVLALLLVSVFLLIPYGYLVFGKQKINIKTEISTLIVFALGALCMITPIIIPIVIAITTTMVLSIKEYLHKAASNISFSEIIDAFKFIIVAFVILPFLPQTSYDHQLIDFFSLITQLPVTGTSQLQILNPYSIWMIVVIISAISFLGYVLIKFMGQKKGISLTGLIGGFYSSTLTSLTLANQSKENPSISTPYIAGITLACASSFLKLFIIIRALNIGVFQRSFLGMAIMTIYLLAAGLILIRLSKKDDKKSDDQVDSLSNQLQSPFKLGTAIKFALILTATFVVANLILTFANLEWYYVLAGLMAFFAVDDPIIISTSQIAGTAISFDTAKNIILGVIMLNMIQKVFMVVIFGNRKLVGKLAIIFGGLILVSIPAFLYL